MFDNIAELAENKLIILYIFDTLNFSISNDELTQIVLQNDLMDYFTMQQYLSELVASDCLQFKNECKGKKLINITQKGSEVLKLFASRIPHEKLQKCTTYLLNNLNKIKKNFSI